VIIGPHAKLLCVRPPILGVPVVSALRNAGRIAFVSACCAAIAIQAVGAFWYTGSREWDALPKKLVRIP
jgi:hypothetical protein